MVRAHLDPGHVILVAGAHRQRAAEILGWTVIPAILREIDEDQARLVEIDENLMRRELNALDRAIFLLERKEVHERLHPETRHGGDRRAIKSQSLRLDPKRFTAEVADKIGLSERAVQTAIQLATNLDREAAKLLRGTPMANNQNALMKLATEPAAKQRTLALQVRDGGARTLDAARQAAGFLEPTIDDPQKRYLAVLLDTWVQKADADTRAQFLAKIGATMASDPLAAPAGRASRKGGAR